MLRVLHSVLFWAFLGASSAALFPVALLIWAVTAPFDRRKRVLHLFTCFWASLYTWTNPAWPTKVLHRERLVSDRACVYVANHLSFLDILVLFRLFTHFKWVSKIENFRVPFIGWNMSLNRYVPLRRGDKTSVIKMMEQCDRLLAEGSPIMMFPEGTRSTSGRMRTFKPGAFELAIKNHVPVVPIAIRGTGDALPKRGFVLQGRHPITVTVLEPIAPSVFAGDEAATLSARVRTVLARELGETESETEVATANVPARAPAEGLAAGAPAANAMN